MKTFTKFIDRLLMIIIVLSILQILIDQLNVIYDWTGKLGITDIFDRVMIIVGFSFDAIFSLEFIVRSIVAIKNKRFKEYFFKKQGWIDLIASIPLLCLFSGPLFYELVVNNVVALSGGRFAGNLKAIRAIRVARILRLLRVLKIFGKIENTESKMNQHQVASISALFVSLSVFVYMLLHFVGFIDFGDNHILEEKVMFTFTMIILVNVFAVSFVYSRLFAHSVSDPIYVIHRGMSEENYNFTAKIDPAFENEEVFQLAETYNTVWLPMKMRIQTIRMRKKEREMASFGSQDDYSDLL